MASNFMYLHVALFIAQTNWKPGVKGELQ